MALLHNIRPINYYASNQLLYVQSEFIRPMKIYASNKKFMRPNKFLDVQ